MFDVNYPAANFTLEMEDTNNFLAGGGGGGGGFGGGSGSGAAYAAADAPAAATSGGAAPAAAAAAPAAGMQLGAVVPSHSLAPQIAAQLFRRFADAQVRGSTGGCTAWLRAR